MSYVPDEDLSENQRGRVQAQVSFLVATQYAIVGHRSLYRANLPGTR